MSRWTQRRASHPMVSSNNLMTEIKSWSRNKLEDRKLAMKQTMVDKDMFNRRRLHESEKQEVSRNMEENIRKTTPSTEEYLDRSQKRYNIWREREQDRLDRRYRYLYKNYMRDFSQLAIQQRNVIMSMHDVSENVDDETPRETRPADDRRQNHSKHSKPSTVGNKGNASQKTLRRRASTGSIFTPSVSINRNTSSRDLPTVQEADAKVSGQADVNFIITSAEENTCNTNNQVDGSGDASNEKKVIRAEAVDNASISKEENETTEESKPKVEESESETNNEQTNKKNPKIKAKRRMSVAPKSSTEVIQISKRLDRRPTLPNIAIPFNYGN